MTRLAALLALVVAAAVPLCAQPPATAPASEAMVPTADRVDNEVRAMWVTRWNYKTPEDVKAIVRNCKELNFNVILFQVRGEATAFYKSNYEPWAWELTGEDPSSLGKDPGWDPLALAVEEAHAHGIELHAWVNVFPAWRSQTYPPRDANQLWWTHPDWFMADASGKRMIPRDRDVNPRVGTWYSFISPGLPEVQDYIADVFADIAANYDIDGIHYDYVRYPAEITEVDEPYRERAEKMGNWSYDAVSLARFREETGVDAPDLNPDAWTKWRAEQITATVRKAAEKMRAHKPNLIISGAVFPDTEDAYSRKYQDYVHWMEQGWMDAAVTMGYTPNLDVFTGRAAMLAEKDPPGYIIAGFNAGYDPEIVVNLAKSSRTVPNVDGFSCFAYTHLFDTDAGHAINEKGKLVKETISPRPAALPWRK